MTIRRPAMVLAVTALLAAATLVMGPASAATTTCSAADLTARQTASGAGMSQPVALVTVTNTASTTCTLRGYPTITGAWSRAGELSIDVSRGPLMNAPPAKPTTIRLAPGEQAWFGIGTATAFDPPIRTIVRIAFTPSRGGATKSVRVALQATAPTGAPIPVTVTPYAPGRGTL
jgi:hypothetical protein